MSDDSRIIELLTDMVMAQAKTTERIDHMEQSITKEIDGLKRQQMKTNVLLQSHSLTLEKLGTVLQNYPEVLNRIERLESAVFH